MERLVYIFLVVALLILAVWGVPMAFDPIGSMIFFPDRELVATPRHLGLDYEDVELETDAGGRSHGWLIPGASAKTILWFHGNAGNISHRLDNIRLLHDLVGASILIIDYGGYGRSDGEPSEQRMYADARAALRFLRGRGVAAEDTVYFGRSLGSAVALDLAVEHPPAKLILETPFESLRAMAGALVPAALARIVPQRFDNLGKISRVRCPILFIHGDRDEIVPFEHSRTLFAAAPEPKAHYRIPGATHNDTYVVGGREYFETIRAFIDD